MVTVADQGAAADNDGSDSSGARAAISCCGVGAPEGFSVTATVREMVLAATVTSGGSITSGAGARHRNDTVNLIMDMNHSAKPWWSTEKQEWQCLYCGTPVFFCGNEVVVHASRKMRVKRFLHLGWKDSAI